MKKKKNTAYSPLHLKYVRSLRFNRIKVLAIQIIIVAALFAIWELAARLELIDSFLTSSPSRIFHTLTSIAVMEILSHVLITLTECIIGFLISTFLGILIAVALWWFETARKVSEPFIVVLNALPKIALGPLIIVWVGVGYQAIVLMTVLICIIVTVISVLNGFMTVDEGKLLLMRSMGAGKLQILTKLVLPFSVPNLISVLKVNVGLAWVGVIMGEYLVSSAGLGYLLIYGGQVLKLDLVMSSILILCVLAALMYLGVAVLEKRAARFK